MASHFSLSTGSANKDAGNQKIGHGEVVGGMYVCVLICVGVFV